MKKENPLKDRNVIIINAMTKSERFAFEAARRNGVGIILVHAQPDFPKRIADHFIQADTFNPREVIDRIQQFREEHPEVRIDGAMTFWEEDIPVLARVCEAFHLPGNSYRAAINTRNKYEMRKKLRDTGLSIPDFAAIKTVRDLTKAIQQIGFPAVMKPAWGSDSELVVLVKDEAEALATFDYLKANANEQFSSIFRYNSGLFLYEEYVDGTEISLECFSQFGIPHVVAMNEKAPMTAPYFIECGDFSPPRLAKEDLDDAVKLAESALIALGVKNSLAHIELKVGSKGPRIIEVASRMGLDDIYLYTKQVWGEDLVRVALMIACGEKVEPKKREAKECIIGRYFIPSSSGIVTKLSNVQEARRLRNICSLEIKKDVGDAVLVPPEGFETMGWVVAKGENFQEAQSHMEEVLRVLDIGVTRFSKGSSLGRLIRSESLSSASVVRERIMRAAKLEKIRTINLDALKGLHIGIVTNSELPDGMDDPTRESELGEKIREILVQRGYQVSLFDMNETPLPIRKIQSANLDFVLNLCEALHNSVHLESHAAALLDVLQIPYSGSSPKTLSLCADKITVKKLFEYHEIPTPDWDAVFTLEDEIRTDLKYPLIVKPADTDSSYGITNQSVVTNRDDLLRQVEKVLLEYKRPALIEEFIEGEEFDACVIGNGPGVRVLPLIRSIFESKEAGVWPIYGADDPEPLEVRLEGPARISEKLSNLICEIAVDCFNLFDLQDYGKVEIRVDRNGNPYVLEVNPNPPIDRDHFFQMSAELNGVAYEDLIEELILIAAQRYKASPRGAEVLEP